MELINLVIVYRQNYIIVGVKFERVDDQIHIRIAEAQALPGNKVNVSTIRWPEIVCCAFD